MSTTRPRPTHRERLLPGPLGWLALVGGAAFVLVALLPVHPVLALVVAAATAAGLAVAAVLGSPVVEVVDGSLRAGRARIPATLLAAPRALDRAGVRRALGPGADARAYVCLRAWVPTAVEVHVVDPADPTPTWLISTRRPQQLLAALQEAGASTPAGSGQAAHSEQTG